MTPDGSAVGRADRNGDPLVVLAGFGRALRASGVGVSSDRLRSFVEALDELDPGSRADVYWAGRITLCANRDELDRYDRVFGAWFDRGRPTPQAPARPDPAELLALVDTGGEEGNRHQAGIVATGGASRRETLRHQDFAGLDATERAEVRALLAALSLEGATRRSRRLVPARRGRVDTARTVRDALDRGGEVAVLAHRRARRRPRRVVLLVDVSGSMRPYAGALLRFAHASVRSAGRRTEAFTIGTRLTRVTDELAARDPDSAMRAVAAAVPDWSGGTRLGDLLKAFLDGWGRRGLARGAVLVICSDGWERDDVGLLAAQMAQLSRLAWRVIWANPLKSRPGYAPLAAGMAAALPYVDDFVEGHSLAALERLAAVVAGARDPSPRPHAARGRSALPPVPPRVPPTIP